MSKRLLVTDDAVIIREMIKDTAIEAGWEIVGEAGNGEEAVQKYRELQPDAMTLDMVMPEYDGLHALREIRKEYPDAKIVVVSAVDQKTYLKEAFSLGAVDFIVKPFDRTALTEALNNIVEPANC